MRTLGPSDIDAERTSRPIRDDSDHNTEPSGRVADVSSSLVIRTRESLAAFGVHDGILKGLALRCWPVASGHSIGGPEAWHDPQTERLECFKGSFFQAITQRSVLASFNVRSLGDGQRRPDDYAILVRLAHPQGSDGPSMETDMQRMVLPTHGTIGRQPSRSLTICNPRFGRREQTSFHVAPSRHADAAMSRICLREHG